MKQNNKIKNMKASDLVLDYTINDRFHGSLEVYGVKVDTYSIDILGDGIKAAGQINVPVVVDGKDNTVLEGMRRITFAKRVVANPEAYSPELVAAMNRIPVIVYDDLTPGERLKLIHDKGDRKGLGRAETLKAVWTMYEQNFSEADISIHQVYNIAKYTGSESKLNALPTELSARNKAIKNWLHGTVGNYMLGGYDCGPRVRKAMMLTDLQSDGLLPKDADGNPTVKPEWTVKRKHVTELVAARTEDAKANEWNGTNFTGPRFNAKLSEIISGAESSSGGNGGGSGDGTGAASMTIAELQKFDSRAHSLVAKATLKVAANQQVIEFPELDKAAARWEQVSNLLARYVTEFSDPTITDFASKVLGTDNLADLEAYFQSKCETPGTPTEAGELVTANS